MKWTGNRGGRWGCILSLIILLQRDTANTVTHTCFHSHKTPLLLAGKLHCHNNRRKKEFDGWQSRYGTLYPLDMVKLLIKHTLCNNSDGTTSVNHGKHQLQSQRLHTLPMCGLKWYCTLGAKCVFPCPFYEDRTKWETQWKAKSSQNMSTASEEPRAMNLINNAMWKLMLFMLCVGIWITEIRVWC